MCSGFLMGKDTPKAFLLMLMKPRRVVQMSRCGKQTTESTG